MAYLEKKVCLIITFIAVVFGVLSHYIIDSINNFKSILLFYLPHLFLAVPAFLFFREKKLEIKESKPLLLLITGYIIGVLLVFIVAIYRLIGLGSLNDLISPMILYVIRGVVIAMVMTGGVWNFFASNQQTMKKVYYLVVCISFSFFILSSLTGFYVYYDVVGFGAPFLRLDVIFSYLFQDFVYFFTIIDFPISVWVKYQLIDWNIYIFLN